MSDSPKPTQSTILVDLAHERYRLGRASTGEPFAVPLDGPHVARLLRGGRDSMRAELAAVFNAERGKAPSAAALADCMLVLEGEAQREPATELHLRAARHGDAILVDLGDESGRVVEVTPGQWKILDRSPVLFRRTELTAALPEPRWGGDVDLLREHVNITDHAWPLLLGWLVAALMPGIAHPIALLTGEQGSGKSTAARTLVQLVDPSPAPLRSSPKDEQDWAVAAAGSWVVAVDNISSISGWFSDALCRAVTGDALIRRRLYSDSDLAILAIQRVVLLTSIDAGALRGDLVDRLLALELEPIHPTTRRSDTDLDAAFAGDQPLILGALLDVLAQVLHALPGVHLKELPRLTDFGRVLAALDTVMGTTALATYQGLGDRLADETIDADPIGGAVRRLAARHPRWAGTPGELLDVLTPQHPPRGWPADATRLSGKLRRSAPALRRRGIDITWRKTNGIRLIELTAGTLTTPDGDAATLFDPASDPDEPPGQPTNGDAEGRWDATGPISLSLDSLSEESTREEIGKTATPATPATLNANGHTNEPPTPPPPDTEPAWLDHPHDHDLATTDEAHR